MKILYDVVNINTGGIMYKKASSLHTPNISKYDVDKHSP